MNRVRHVVCFFAVMAGRAPSKAKSRQVTASAATVRLSTKAKAKCCSANAVLRGQALVNSFEKGPGKRIACREMGEEGEGKAGWVGGGNGKETDKGGVAAGT